MVASVVEGQAGVAVLERDGFGHLEVAEELGVYPSGKECFGGHEAVLMGVLAASEPWFGEGFFESESLGLVFFQLGVEYFGVADGLAGVPDGDASDLVGSREVAFWDGPDDGGLDFLPVGGCVGLSEDFDGLVVGPATSGEPTVNGFSLLGVRVYPDFL